MVSRPETVQWMMVEVPTRLMGEWFEQRTETKDDNGTKQKKGDGGKG